MGRLRPAQRQPHAQFCSPAIKGKLYVGGGPETWGVFSSDARQEVASSPRNSRKKDRSDVSLTPCAATTDKLYVAFPGVYDSTATNGTIVGNPLPIEDESDVPTHSLSCIKAELLAGTWPEAKVAVYKGDENVEEIGRVGEDGTEVNSLVVYNGKLYGGSLPRSEVCRYDGGSKWTSLKRFYSPDGWSRAFPPRLSERKSMSGVA